jgi:hypothetical protein
MKLLTEQDDADWEKLQSELHSSDEEIEDEQENMSWYDWKDPDTYFTLCTKYKNTYEANN